MLVSRFPHPLSSFARNLGLPRRPQQRAFLPNPFAVAASAAAAATSNSPPQLQRLTATRTLPYAQAAIYDIIADVSSYSTFLPFCTRSAVTRWSAPTPGAAGQEQRRWPSEARLAVGWSGIEEAFVSRIYCVPGRVVEATGGDAVTALDPGDIQHHLRPDTSAAAQADAGSGRERDRASEILTHLQSRWTLSPAENVAAAAGEKGLDGNEATSVRLDLEFAFANPLYSAMSSAVTPKVAGAMVEAFERRVHEVLGGGGGGGQ